MKHLLRGLAGLLVALGLGASGPASAQTQGFVGGSPPSYADVIGIIDGSGNVTTVSPSNPLPTTIGTNSSATIAVSLTRTNDTNAYTANDVVGSATGSTAALTFALVGPSAANIRVLSAELEIDATAVISGETSYRLYLYNVTPPSALGDNAAWDLPSGDRASYLGYIDLGTPVDLGSTLYVQSEPGKDVKLAGTSLFGYLVTIGAYIPTASRVHKITLHTAAY